MKDSIILNNLQAFCRLGCYDVERILGQCVTINIELELDLEKPGRSNNVKDSVDYVEVSILIRKLAQSREFILVENLAHEICENIFKSFSPVDAIRLEIIKTIVNAEQFTGTPGIRIYRQRKQLSI